MCSLRIMNDTTPAASETPKLPQAKDQAQVWLFDKSILSAAFLRIAEVVMNSNGGAIAATSTLENMVSLAFDRHSRKPKSACSWNPRFVFQAPYHPPANTHTESNTNTIGWFKPHPGSNAVYRTVVTKNHNPITTRYRIARTFVICQPSAVLIQQSRATPKTYSHFINKVERVSREENMAESTTRRNGLPVPVINESSVGFSRLLQTSGLLFRNSAMSL